MLIATEAGKTYRCTVLEQWGLFSNAGERMGAMEAIAA